MAVYPSPSVREIHQHLAFLGQQHSFGDDMHPMIDQVISDLAGLRHSRSLSQQDLISIQYYYGRQFLENTLQGMALLKPYGYAGDFMMIDRIYTGEPSGNPFYQSWDHYFQQHAAPRAVRNRKDYFKQWAGDPVHRRPGLHLLNVASGPARDLAELFDQGLHPSGISCTCVEMDAHAVEYAKKLLRPHLDKVRFINRNIFRFDSEEQYDLIWSAGLFDYFDDKAFVFILKKFRQWIKPGGEIVVGNFNQQHNPTRDYMELLGEWYLHHRSGPELISLALQAGFTEEQIRIGHEPEKVNLFLHCQANSKL